MLSIQRMPRSLEAASASLEEVDAVALDTAGVRTSMTSTPNWAKPNQATEALRVSVQRVKQLLDAGQVPYVVHHSGVRPMRREQLETVANSRQARLVREGR